MKSSSKSPYELIITESYVRRSGVRKWRGRCPKTKRVLGWSGFSFRCHRATNRKKGREEQTCRIVPTQINIKIKINEGTYAWKLHEHVTCKLKNIMGSAQSKPTSTHHCNKVNTHLKFMNIVKNANVMQCMNIVDHLNKNHPKNFRKTSSILKNPKNFPKKKKKTQKLGHNAWNVW